LSRIVQKDTLYRTKKLIRIAKRILILNDQILGLINPKGTEKVEKRKEKKKTERSIKYSRQIVKMTKKKLREK